MRKILVMLAAGVLFSGCSLLNEDTVASLKEKAIEALKTSGVEKAKDLVVEAVADEKITQAQADLVVKAIDAGADKLNKEE